MRSCRAVTLPVLLLAAAACPAFGADPEDFHFRVPTPRTPGPIVRRGQPLCLLPIRPEEYQHRWPTWNATCRRGLTAFPADALMQACRKRHLEHGRAAAPERLAWCSDPMILHVDDTHFISFLGWDHGRLVLFDNQAGLFDCTPQWFAAHYRWDGAALVIGTPSPPVLLLLYGPDAVAVACGAGALFLLGWYFLARRKVGANAALKAPAPA